MYLESSRSKVHVIGGVDALKLDQVCDFVRLILDEDLESISDRYIKMFVTYGGGDLAIWLGLINGKTKRVLLSATR